MLAQPVTVDEIGDQTPIEAALLGEVDILDAGLAVTKLGVAQAAFEPSILALGCLAIEQKAEPFGMVETFGFRVVGELLEGLGHAGEAELIELAQGWMKQHGRPPIRSLEVGWAAGMLVMGGRLVGGVRIGRTSVDVVLQDRSDRAVGQAVDLEGAAAGGFEAIGPIALAQAKDAETGAEALLGMRLLFEDGLDQASCVRADGLGFGLQALMGPAGVATMGARHVLARGGVPPLLPGAEMAHDPAAAMEQFDGARSDACADRLPSQAMGDGVVVLVDLDVIVDADPTFLPLGVFVGLRRQRREGWLVDLVEQLETRRAEMAGRFAIELVDELEDGLIERGQRDEATVPELGQNPAFDNLDSHLCFCFVERRQMQVM